MKCLFEDYQNQPKELKRICDKYSKKYIDYNKIEKFLAEINSTGFTFDYGLDCVPYALRPINTKLEDVEGYNDIEENYLF